VVHQIDCALDARIGQYADFLAVEAVPFPAVEISVELKYKLGVYEIDKGVANIA